MLDETEIRNAKPSDVDAIIELWKKLMNLCDSFNSIWKTSPDAETIYRNGMKNYFEKHQSIAFFFLAEDKATSSIDGYISGYFAPKYDPLFTLGKYGKILAIYVRESHRNKKLGTRLVDEVKKWYTNHDINEIHLDVATSNSVGLSFWKKLGFTPFNKQMFYRQ